MPEALCFPVPLELLHVLACFRLTFLPSLFALFASLHADTWAACVGAQRRMGNSSSPAGQYFVSDLSLGYRTAWGICPGIAFLLLLLFSSSPAQLLGHRSLGMCRVPLRL